MPPLQHYKPDRDTVTTIREDGSRRFLYPADAPGRFLSGRRAVAWVLIAVYLLLPWIQVGGYPAVFLDVLNRRFHLFGLTLAAQDLFVLFFLISGLGFALFFITALLGRLWCGWACPQTVFLDHVYRRIERWVDGDALERRKLADAPWSGGKIAKRVLKHGLYIVISALLAHLFLAYYVSIPAVWGMMKDAPTENWGTFVFIAVATGVVYFNFAWFREQLCVVLCPYGRLQSVLTDDNTLVIGYDSKRGEPRGKPDTPNVGACVDCDRCVRVCPTGIDIRHGLQLECIGCAACVDACDDVMGRLERPKGLIRYDSLAGLAGKKTKWIRPRTILYSILLVIGMSVATWNISGIRPAVLSVTRMIGAPYFMDEQVLRNQYLIRVINTRGTDAEFVVTCEGLPAGATTRGLEGTIKVSPLGEEVRPLIVQIPRAKFGAPFVFSVAVSNTAHSFKILRSMEFLGPDASSTLGTLSATPGGPNSQK